MAQLVVLYKKAQDAAAFNSHYSATHAPLAKKIPGLKDYQISSGPVSTPQGESSYQLVATLTFDSIDAIKKGLSSPEGQAAAGDLANFAQAGVELLMFETKPA
jgi:uncharacterized protein (TIGR02118 family)